MRVNVVKPYNSSAMHRMTEPLQELGKLHELTMSQVPDISADVNIHCPWHTMNELQDKGNGKHILIYTHCNPNDQERLIQACEKADLITCMSYEGRRELVWLGVDPHKLWVVYCAADAFNFRRRGITVCGFVQPNGRKRENILLELAWQHDLSAFEFLFIGSGWEPIAQQMASLGVSCHLAPTQFDEGLATLYGQSDVVLVTGYREGGPLPLLEALASGTKVLSPKLGYAADLLPEDCYYETVEDLYEKLERLVHNEIELHQMVRSWKWTDYAAEYALLVGRLTGESVDLYPERGMSRYNQLLDIIDEVKPIKIHEIGTWNGHNAARMIQQASKYNDGIQYTGFDLFETQTGEHFRKEFSKVGWNRNVVRKKLQATRANIVLIEGNTRVTLKDNHDAPDLIFVDGGHSETTIQNDGAWALARNDATVVFDDYYTEGKPDGMGCNKFIQSLDLKEYEVTYLPVTTSTEDGRVIQMVKVRKRAGISVPVSTWTSNTNYAFNS